MTHDRVIDEDGKIAVRKITRIFDEGIEVSKKYHRSWVMPGDDPSKADVISKAVALKIHTPELIAIYKANIAKQSLINKVGSIPVWLAVMLPPQIVAITFLICEYLS